MRNAAAHYGLLPARTLRGVAEKGSENADRVSLIKPVGASGAPAATVQRPKQVTWVVVALLLTGLLAVAASLSLYGLHSFLVHQLTKANADLKGSDHQTRAQLLKSASQQPTASLIQSAIFLLSLSSSPGRCRGGVTGAAGRSSGCGCSPR